MIKKNKFLALALVTILLLAACGNGAAPAAQNGAANGVSASAVDASFPRGSITGNTYTSDFTQLTFTLPDETWDFFNDASLAQLMGISPDLMPARGEAVDFYALGVTIWDDMIAFHSETGSGVGVTIEDLTSTPYAELISIEDHIEDLKARLEAFEFTVYTLRESSERTIGGNLYHVIAADVDIQGFTGEQYIILRRQGSHMITININIYGDMTFDQVIAYIS